VGTGIRLWRSASPDGGAFTKVYEGVPDGYPTTTTFTIADRRIWWNGLWSDDDGVSWNAVPRWR
jgi:hypothetical protein